MITLNRVSKNFDSRMLMDDVTLSIFPKERIGLTGPNGAGKSTLFRIILGDMEPTDGDVNIQKNIKVGYMPQEAHFDSKRTVMDEVTSGDDEIRSLLDEKQRMEDEGLCAEMRYGDILEKLEQLGIYELEPKAEKILAGLGFKEEEFHKPIVQLSGGWQMRTLLARLLTYDYDLLLLDEPTNYLDLGATIWLKGYLATYPGSFVMISHDKIFLNDVTNYTIVLENGRMTKIKGNYEYYEQTKAVEARTIEKQQRVIEQRKAQLERFAQRFHAQPNRASAVKNKRKMIEKLEEQKQAIPQDQTSIGNVEFPPAKQSGYNVMTMSHIKKSYPDKTIYTDLNLEVIRGQKICLVGPNGAGKSTLLKMMADVLPFDSGKRKLGSSVEMGYFSQSRLDVLNPNRTVLEELLSAVERSIPQAQARTLLGVFNFHGDDVFKLVRVLSGGEKSRLILAKLLINPPNLLLLDEPTTHLDIHGVEALTKAFKQFDGTMCFISHDLFFIREVANHIIEVDQGILKHYEGGLQYYLDKKEGRSAFDDHKHQPQQHQEKKQKKKVQEPVSNAVKEAERKHKEALKRLKEIKKLIDKLNEEEKSLETESYVKARVLSNSYGKDKAMLKEYGQRLKDIQTRMREIESERNALNQEKNAISK